MSCDLKWRERTPNNGFRLQLKFWGVRGSIPTPRFDNLALGGNTTCIEVRRPYDNEVLIIDGGTGLRDLGVALLQESQGHQMALHFLLTHFHWDHIQGVPFFAPLYSGASEVAFYSSRPSSDLKEILKSQMTYPYFPVSFDVLAARRNFVQIASKPVRFGYLSVRS